MILRHPNILFAWELGEGLGHLPALKAIAQAMKGEGFRPVFALRETAAARTMLSGIADEILTAPFWLTPAVPQNPTHSYADLITGNGYASREDAVAMIAAWDRILDQVKPALIVCEHSPSVIFSAFKRVPVAMVGNGFLMPPADGDWFPPYDDAEHAPHLPVATFGHVCAAFETLGRLPPQSLCEAFRTAFRGIYSFPALDHYRQDRKEMPLGPIEAMPKLSSPPREPHLYAYAAADSARIDEMTLALMNLGRRASVFFRGKPGARASVLRSRGVHVYDEAPAFDEVFARASVVFSHGGSGFAQAAFAAGKPQIIYPRHLEAKATAQALEGMGAGLTLESFSAANLQAALDRVQSEFSYSAVARAAGVQAQQFARDARALETTTQALLRILR